jgi:hypothetical protein
MPVSDKHSSLLRYDNQHNYTLRNNTQHNIKNVTFSISNTYTYRHIFYYYAGCRMQTVIKLSVVAPQQGPILKKYFLQH